MVLGAAVGLAAGLLAVLLNRALLGADEVFGAFRGHRGWRIFLPALGAAAAAIFLNQIIREQPGHGVGDVIYAISRNRGFMRFRSSVSRLVASFLTIAAGGSAGPEAPVVFSGAAVGSNIGTALHTSERARATFVACGAAGAIGAIFNAPITGIVFALEVILGEWAQINIIPIAVASVTGTHVGRILLGGQIPFEHQRLHPTLMDSVAAIGLALLAVLVSQGLMRALWWTEAWAPRAVRARWLRAGCGGLAVGAIGFFVPSVLGEGYGVVRSLIGGTFAPGIWLVAAIVASKIVATCLTLGTGGSGGIFAPSLFIGSAMGVCYRRILGALLGHTQFAVEGCYALLGMAALVSGALQAPLTGMFLVVEITGSWEVILPLIVVSTITPALSRYLEPASVYTRDLLAGGDLIRPRTDARILGDIMVTELIERDSMPVEPQMSMGELVDVVRRSRRNSFPVLDSETQAFLGMLHLDDVRKHLFDPRLYDIVLVANVMKSDVACVGTSATLAHTLDVFEQVGTWSLPVVDGDRFVGLVSKSTILDHYRRELMAQTES